MLSLGRDSHLNNDREKKKKKICLPPQNSFFPPFCFELKFYLFFFISKMNEKPILLLHDPPTLLFLP